MIKKVFSQLDSLTLAIILASGLVLGSMLLAAAVKKLSCFRQELCYVNMEIARTDGEERAYWQRKKRRLWCSLLFFCRR